MKLIFMAEKQCFMDRSFGLFFYLKKGKGYSSGEVPIYVRITINGYSFEISAKRKCLASRWTQAAGRMSGKGDEVKAFNAYLDTLQQKVFEAKRKLLELDKPLTPDNMKTILFKKETVVKRMILQIFAHHNEQMASPCSARICTRHFGTLSNVFETYKRFYSSGNTRRKTRN